MDLSIIARLLCLAAMLVSAIILLRKLGAKYVAFAFVGIVALNVVSVVLSRALSIFRADLTIKLIFANVLFIALSVCLILFTKRLYSNQNEYRLRLVNNWDKVAFVVIASIMLLFMIRFSEMQSFWLDEMYQIGFVHESLSWKEILEYRLMETSPPLYSLLFAVWYRIAPYGARWLLLPSELAVCIGLYFVGLLGSSMINKRVGVFAAALTASSSFLILHAGHEIRSYALYFMLSAMTVYTYSVRNRQKGKENAMIIFYGISMLLLAFSHYFGALIIAGLFLSDLFLFIKKRIRIKAAISYFIAGIPLFGWLALMVFKGPVSALKNFWTSIPTYKNLLDVTDVLLSNNNFLNILFLVAFSYVFVNTVVRIKNRCFDFDKDYMQILLLMIFVFVIGVTYIYSTEINPNGSLFVYRYFIGIIFIPLIIISILLDKACCFFANKETNTVFAIALCAMVLLFGTESFDYVAEQSKKLNQPFRESADWLSNRNDIYDASTMVISSGPSSTMVGWDYYISKQGNRECFNVMASWNNTTFESYNECIVSTEKLNNISTIYTFEQVWSIPQKISEYIEKNFEQVDAMKTYKITVYQRK